MGPVYDVAELLSYWLLTRTTAERWSFSIRVFVGVFFGIYLFIYLFIFYRGVGDWRVDYCSRVEDFVIKR